MDDADRAQEAMEVLDAARSRTIHAAEAEATGYCLWCDARLAPNQRWCSAECRDDHMKQLAAESRNGTKGEE